MGLFWENNGYHLPEPGVKDVDEHEHEEIKITCQQDLLSPTACLRYSCISELQICNIS